MNQIDTHAHTLMHESIEQETIDMSKMTVALQPLNAFPPIQMHRAQCQKRVRASVYVQCNSALKLTHTEPLPLPGFRHWILNRNSCGLICSILCAYQYR